MRPKNRDDLRVVKTFLFFLIATPALALGAVHAESIGIYFSLAALFAGHLFIVRKASMPPLDFPSAVMLGLIVFTWFQLIPLPSSVVSIIAPSVYEIRSAALSPLHQGAPHWMSLTLDATLTATEVGKLAFYLIVYWGARYVVRRHGPDSILRIVTAAGVIGAAVLICHRILMPDTIYGFYTPKFALVVKGRISAPLINENHMAAFLGLCATVAVGRAVQAEDRASKIIASALAAVLGGTVVLTLSRGGIAAFIAGQCLFVGLGILAKKKNVSSSRAAWIPAILAASLGLGMFVAQDALLGELLNGGMEKFDLLLEELPLLTRFPSTGAGRGAFIVAFPLVSTKSAATVVTHAENVVIQYLTDWGLLVGGCALIAGVFVIGRFLVRPPSSAQCASAVAALTAFCIHNLIDFNLEILGVAVVAAALVGVLYGRESMSRRPQKRRVPGPVVAFTGATAAAAAIFAFSLVRQSNLDRDHERLRSEIKNADSTLFSHSALREILDRHPADATIPLFAGIRFYHFKTENPLPWLARAVILKPFMPEAHFYIGAVLFREGFLDQAMLEFREAFRIKPSLAGPSARLLVGKMPVFDKAAKAAVTKEDQMVFFPALAEALSARRLFDEADKADLAVLRILPNDKASTARHIQRLMDHKAFNDAEKWANQMMKRDDSYGAGVLLLSEMYALRGAFAQSAALLEDALKKTGGNPEMLQRLATAKQRMGDFDGAIEAAEILKAAGKDASERAQALLFEAELYEADRRLQGALSLLREAHALVPTDIGILEKMFVLAQHERDDKRALEALKEMMKARPGDRTVQSRLKAYEAALKRSALNPEDTNAP